MISCVVNSRIIIFNMHRACCIGQLIKMNDFFWRFLHHTSIMLFPTHSLALFIHDQFIVLLQVIDGAISVVYAALVYILIKCELRRLWSVIIFDQEVNIILTPVELF